MLAIFRKTYQVTILALIGKFAVSSTATDLCPTIRNSINCFTQHPLNMRKGYDAFKLYTQHYQIYFDRRDLFLCLT